MNPTPQQLDEFDLNGRKFKLGNLVPVTAPSPAWTLFGASPTTPLIPRSEWKDRIDAAGKDHVTAWPMPYVHDQNGIGMCNCSATASAMESTRLKQGLSITNPRKLSAGDLYRRICYNGQDSGSILEDGIRVAMAEGLPTTDTCPYLDWKTNHSASGPERPANKVLEAFLCPTFDTCMSAVLSAYDLISGIMWYDSYRPTAQTGWWLPPAGGSAGGHAIHGFKATYRMNGSNIEYGIWHKNSWTGSFGDNGRFVIAERQYAGNVGGWWAVRDVVDEGNVVPPAPSE